MSRFRSLVPALLLFVILIAPLGASAAETGFFGPLIPEVCNCLDENGKSIGFAGWGCVLGIVNNTINLALSLGVIFAVLLFMYAGALFILNPINAEYRSKGKKVMLNTVVGLVIALGAWLIVNTILTVLTDYTVESITSELGQESPACLKVSTQTGPNPNIGLSGEPTVTAPPAPTACSNCITLDSVGISHKPAGTACNQGGIACVTKGGCDNVPVQNPPVSSCMVNGVFADKLKSALRSGMWVTEAWPPTRDHRNSCHQDGTCVDADYQDNRTDAASVNAFINAASATGLGVVYELPNVASCRSVRDAGVSERYLAVVSGINGAHFSVYNSPKGTQPGCK